jgi:lysozyme family protein
MADFKKAYEIGRINEGGYSNVKSDKGGETYCGISRVNWPQWQGWEIVDEYKGDGPIKRNTVFNDAVLEALVYDFYKENFWKKISGDAITSDSVAAYIYDWTLTSGSARKKIQQNLGLDADGVFGPATIAKINGTTNMLDFVRSLRVAHYKRIVEKDPEQGVNLSGWLNRANGLYEKLTS